MILAVELRRAVVVGGEIVANVVMRFRSLKLRQRGAAWLACACMTLLVLAANAPAQQAEPCFAPDAPLDASARVNGLIPGDVGLVLMVSDAAAQRTTPAGTQMTEVLVRSGLVPIEARRAWSDLAKALNWTPAEAFDGLLGHHAMLMVRSSDAARAGHAEWADEWVLASDLDAEAARRVRERLAPSPRQVVDGLQILSLDQGRILAAVAPPALGGRLLGPRRQGHVLLLAASGSERLFHQVLPTIAGPGLDARFAPELARPLGPQALLMVRPDRRTGAEGMIAVTIGCAPDGWDARLVASPSALGLDVAKAGDWSFLSLERLAPGAAVALLGAFSPADAGRPSLAGLVSTIWPEYGQLQSRLTGQMGLIVRESSSRVDDERASLAVTLASQATNAGEFRLIGDRASAALALRLQGVAGADSPKIDAIGIEGGFEALVGPADIRDVVLGGGVMENPAWPLDARGWFGERPVLSWGYAMDQQAPSGWWVASLGASRSDDVERLRGVLCCGPESGDGHRRVLTGVVRPASLASTIRAIAGANGQKVPWAWPEAIERVTFDLWAVGGAANAALIEGQVQIRMQPASGSPSGTRPAPAVFHKR